MKEKIGLLTIHDTINYGSLLQTFATYAAIEKLGYEVEVIDYKCKAIYERETTYSLSEIKKASDIIRWFLWHKKLKEKKEKFDGFVCNEMKLSSISYNRDNIKDANDIYKTFIVGSDIVWGMNITGNDFTYFLDFTDENKKRISFSSSIGTAWEKQFTAEIKKNLLRFDNISVREQLASEWVKETIDKEVPVTCDPTMLWDSKYWSRYTDDQILPKEKYVLIYMAMNDKSNITDGIEYARKKGIKAYYIDFYKTKSVKGLSVVKPVSIQQFISLIKNADTIFSASYHGLLFSLYFHKNVFFYNRGNKSRMISLSKELKIQNREGTPINLSMDVAIDYEFVDSVINKKRQESWSYLENVLREAEDR